MASRYNAYKQLFAFSESVRNRYSTDWIMNGKITALVVFMPMILYFILRIISNLVGGQFDIINDFSNSATMVLMAIQYLVLALILYRMYARLRDHSERDEGWRDSLIGYAGQMGEDTDRLRSIDAEIRKKEKFRASIPALFFMGLLLIFTVFLLLVYIPCMEANGYATSNGLVNWIADNVMAYTYQVTGGKDPAADAFYSIQQVYAGILIVLLLLMGRRIIRFPGMHESNQARFTAALADSFRGLGVSIPPMGDISSDSRILWLGRNGSGGLRLALAPLSVILYPVYALANGSRNMNKHLKNQWTYEANLVKCIASGQEEGFKDGVYSDFVGKANSTHKPEKRKVKKELETSVLKENRMPLALVAAELFVVMMCASYCLKVVSLEFEMISDYGNYAIGDTTAELSLSAMTTLFLVILDLCLLIITLDALLGIASRRPSSWRKVTRSCITFIIPLWLAAYLAEFSGFSHLFDFNPFITTGVLFDILLIMVLSRKIRAYYTPVDRETVPTKSWVRYILFGEL